MLMAVEEVSMSVGLWNVDGGGCVDTGDKLLGGVNDTGD